MSFVGSWRVSEAVYNADGGFQGVVRQLRSLEPIGDDRYQVIQVCEPDARLAGHPMARFAGEHRFELAIDGRRRRYLGPAVLGDGMGLGEGAMIGRGVWPTFGYNFSSWSVLASTGHQLTGGCFHIAGREVAVVVGLAVPDTGVWPSWPPTARARSRPRAGAWQGSLVAIDAQGSEARRAVTRRDHASGWTEWVDGRRFEVTLTLEGERMRLAGEGNGDTWVGFARRFGPLLRYEAVAGDAIVRGLEACDASGRLVGIRSWSRHGLPDRAEVLRMHACKTTTLD